MEKSEKWRVANDPDTPSETLDELSVDQDWMIRSAVAKNRNTPKETLKKDGRKHPHSRQRRKGCLDAETG